MQKRIFSPNNLKKITLKSNDDTRKRCSVPFCRNSNTTNDGVVFYMFPSEKLNQTRFEKWKARTGVVNAVDAGTHICNEHFINSDFYPTANNHEKLLRPTAIPSVNLPDTSENIDLRIEKISSGSPNKPGKLLNTMGNKKRISKEAERVMNQYFGEYKKAKLNNVAPDTYEVEILQKENVQTIETLDSENYPEFDEVYYLDDDTKLEAKIGQNINKKDSTIQKDESLVHKQQQHENNYGENPDENQYLIEIPAIQNCHHHHEEQTEKLNQILTFLQQITDKIENVEKNVNERLNKIEESVTNLRFDVNELASHKETVETAAECDFRKRLPCSTETDVYTLEEELETNSDTVNKLQTCIQQMDVAQVQDIETFTINVLSMIFENEVATKFSWSFNANNRLPIRKFKLIAIVQDQIRKLFQLESNRYEEVDRVMIRWFEQSQQRIDSNALNK